MSFYRQIIARLGAILISVGIIVYVLVMNFLNVGETYILNIGTEGDTSTSRSVYLADPTEGDRISERRSDSYGTTYRKLLTREPVYIYVKPPLQPVNIQQIVVEIRFKGDLDLDTAARLRDIGFKKNEVTEIDETFRGNISFCIYLKDTLNLTLGKQVLNWYSGCDEYLIELYDAGDRLVFKDKLLDDGITINSKKKTDPQFETFSIHNLEEGLYSLRLTNLKGDNKSPDSTITCIEINTNKIVSTGRIHILTPCTLSFGLSENTVLEFYVWHREALQTVVIEGTTNRIINLDESSFKKRLPVELPPGKYSLSAKGDLYISGTNFAFTKNSWFQPYKYTPLVTVSSHRYPGEGAWLLAREVFYSSDIMPYEGKFLFRLQKRDGGSALIHSFKVSFKRG